MNLQHDHSCPFPSPYYYSSYYVKNPSTEKEMYEVSTYIHSYLVGNLDFSLCRVGMSAPVLVHRLGPTRGNSNYYVFYGWSTDWLVAAF